MHASDQLQPTSTLEFRFGREMASKDELGVPVANSPVVIDPPLPGSFTWLSRRSGVYVPWEAPRMGVTYRIAVRPDLQDAAGKPMGAGFKAAASTPAFGTTAVPPNAGEHLQANPEIKIAFNRDVTLVSAQRAFRFVSDKGTEIPAQVRYATKRDYFTLRPEAESWEARWQQAHQPAAAAADSDYDVDEEEDAAVPQLPLQNRLILTPKRTLEPGAEWRLEMGAGVEAVTEGYKLAKAQSWPLGSVAPFTIRQVQSSSYLNSGKSVVVTFSGELARDINEENAAKFFTIEPAVANLKYDLNYVDMTLRGDFVQGTAYRLTVGPGVISAEGLPFTGERQVKFDLGPVKPRVYLPKITGHQILGGARKFPVVSVNMKSLHVVARLVGERIPQAVAAFEKYDKEYDEKHPEERYQKLAAGAVGGKVIYEKTLPLTAEPIDARQETVLDWTEMLGGVKAGVIFLTVEGEPSARVGGPAVGAQALMQLTDLGVLWKKLEDRLQLSVFSMATGAPLPGVKLAHFSPAFAAGQALQSDAKGGAALKIPEEPGWVVARLGSDTHCLRIDDRAEELPMAAFHVPVQYENWGEPAAPAEKYRWYIFTDRPLYRPGETVHVKGYVRQPGERGGLTAAPRVQASLALILPAQKGVRYIEVKTDERGSFDADVVLDSYLVGRHSMQLQIGDTDGAAGEGEALLPAASFQVAEFQPNAFELEIAAPARLAPGEALKAQLTRRYFFGGTLAGSKVTWTLQAGAAAFTPLDPELFIFGDEDRKLRNSQFLNGEGELSKDGAFSIVPKLPEAQGVPTRAQLTVEVTDANQQTVSETKNIMRDAAELYVGLRRPDELMLAPTDEIVARAVAVSPDGKPLTTPQRVSVELIRINFNVVRVQGAGNAISFQNETKEEVVAKADGETLVPQRTVGGWDVKSGETARFKPGKVGEYKLRVTATDAHGHKTASSFHFNVSGQDPASWDYRHPAQVELVTDKLEYQPGDVAKVMVKTPISGEALISIEREARVLRSMRVRLEGNAPTFEMPIGPGDAPNVFVSLMLIRGAEQSTRKYKVPEYRYGLCELKVFDRGAGLSVDVETKTPKVQPGQEIAADVVVHDASGTPLANAEVTFAALDEGVLSIVGYERPNPLPAFNKPVPLKVRTGLTLYELLAEDPADLEFGNKGYLIGGGGVDGPGPKLRRNFPGTAVWLPSLKTDKAGRVQVKFTAPDALTRYRLVAIASAGGVRFGGGESSVTISKPLILLSALGQAAHNGDEIVARALVRNESGRAGEAEVTLELDGHAESASRELTAQVSLKTGESRAIDFPVRLCKAGTADWKFLARMTAGNEVLEDAIAAPLRIEPAGVILRETYLTELTEKTNDLLAGVNPQLVEGAGGVRVTLANTRLAGLEEAAESLLRYSYGCAEQQLSSLVPWILTRELGPVLPEFKKNTPEERNRVIRKGAEKVFAQQTFNGGIAYWPGGRTPSLFASAYTAIVMSMLDPEQKLDLSGWGKLVDYLSKELRGLGAKHDASLDDYALAMYALALTSEPEPAYVEQLYNRRAELSGEGRGFLACAIAQTKGQPAMIGTLLDPREDAPETMSWFGSATRERAIRLMAWSQYKPADKEVGRLVKELLASRVSGHWRNTQENAWALVGLARYFARVEKEVKPVTGELARAEKKYPFALAKAQKTKSLDFTFDAETPLGQLEASNPTKAPLYGEATFVVEPPVGAQPRQDRGYTLSRAYRKLAANGSLQEAKKFEVGDRVLVTLRISTTAPGHFVAIDDPLPGILEAVNPEFRAQAVGGGEKFEKSWAADYQEIRADRVLYFCDHLAPGTYTFQYLARVRSAGAATAPSAKVEEMYRPERFGLSEVARLESAAR